MRGLQDPRKTVACQEGEEVAVVVAAEGRLHESDAEGVRVCRQRCGGVGEDDPARHACGLAEDAELALAIELVHEEERRRDVEAAFGEHIEPGGVEVSVGHALDVVALGGEAQHPERKIDADDAATRSRESCAQLPGTAGDVEDAGPGWHELGGAASPLGKRPVEKQVVDLPVEPQALVDRHRDPPKIDIQVRPRGPGCQERSAVEERRLVSGVP